MTPHAVKQAASAACEKPIRKVSILGAGVMGLGIADVVLRAGISVVLFDHTPEIAIAAADHILHAHKSHPICSPHFDRICDLPTIQVARTDAGIAAADLIIEAVPEDTQLKAAVFARLQPHLRDHTILATNSSSIPVSQLAATLPDPRRLCGLHFCHPVKDRPLVEVIRTNVTLPQTIQQVTAFVRQLRMLPVVMPDRPGFLLNRLLIPYLNESLELLRDGVHPDELEQAALDFGMPMGPLRNFDEFGIDIALAAGQSLYREFPERIVPSALLIAMYKSGRRGRKAGGGFYSTDNTGMARLDPVAMKLITDWQRKTPALPCTDVSRRLFLPMLLEALRALEDAVVDQPSIIERVLQNGLGMTASFSGLFAWADAIGPRQIVDWLRSLARVEPRFEPTPLLNQLAAENTTFLSLSNSQEISQPA